MTFSDLSTFRKGQPPSIELKAWRSVIVWKKVNFPASVSMSTSVGSHEIRRLEEEVEEVGAEAHTLNFQP